MGLSYETGDPAGRNHIQPAYNTNQCLNCDRELLCVTFNNLEGRFGWQIITESRSAMFEKVDGCRGDRNSPQPSGISSTMSLGKIFSEGAILPPLINHLSIR